MTKPGAIPDARDRAMVFDDEISAKDFVLESPPPSWPTDNRGDPFQYQMKAIQLVIEKYNRDIVDLNNQDLLTENEVFVVWFAKTLQNWKALVSTDRSDGRYYELTYNGELQETYVDVYRKTSNETISDYER